MTDKQNLDLKLSRDQQVRPEDHAISIPIPNQDLGAFISALLGQSQTINRVTRGTFCMDKDWLVDMHHLINQRITQQHEAQLVNFSATVLFEDGLSRKLESLEAFITYSEPRSIVSTGVKIAWTYLIKFPQKKVPEKQEIRFFASRNMPKNLEAKSLVHVDQRNGEGFVEYEISHTERTWGDDLEALLAKHLQQKIRVEGSIIKTCRSLALIPATVLSILISVFPIIMQERLKEERILAVVEDLDEMPTVETVAQLGQKFDGFIEMGRIESEKPGVFAVIGLLLGYAGAAAVFFGLFYLKDMFEPSFVLFTERSRKVRADRLRRRFRNKLIGAISFALAVIAGVAANYIYHHLSL